MDTDILVQGDISKLFSLPIEDKLYAKKEYDFNGEGHGAWFFDFTKFDKLTPALNSGILLFQNTALIRTIFSEINTHIANLKKTESLIPLCMDQSFIVYHFFKNNACDVDLISKYIYLAQDTQPPVLTDSSELLLSHFVWPIGNTDHKKQRMLEHLSNIDRVSVNKNINISNLNFTVPTVTCKTMGKFGSDKGSENIEKSWHNYTIIYNELFKKFNSSNVRIFELGLGTNNLKFANNMGVNGKPGASLYAWAELFPKSFICAADIDRGILLNTDRITPFYCDQTYPDAIKALWANSDCIDGFDIIIDDGYHEFNANVTFFENSIHKLNKGGYYIIEDIANNNIHTFKNKMAEWQAKYTTYVFQLIQIPSNTNRIDNTMMIISNP